MMRWISLIRPNYIVFWHKHFTR